LEVGGTTIKGRLVSKNKQIMILEKKGHPQKISVNEIHEVKVRKFSILKTVGAIGGAYVFIGIAALANHLLVKLTLIEESP